MLQPCAGVNGQRTLQHFNAATIKGVFSSQIQPLEQSEHVAGAKPMFTFVLRPNPFL